MNYIVLTIILIFHHVIVITNTKHFTLMLVFTNVD